MTTTTHPLLKVDEVAALLGISRKQVYNLVEHGKLHCINLSYSTKCRMLRFRQVDIDEFLTTPYQPENTPGNAVVKNIRQTPELNNRVVNAADLMAKERLRKHGLVVH